MRSKLPKWFRVLGWAVAALFFLLILGLLLARPLLCVDSGMQPADVIIVPGGGHYDRIPRAAELFLAGMAPKVIITGRGDCQHNRFILMACGVPPSAIITECDSTSTKQNADFVAPLLQAEGVKKAIIVTSWYHSRRALRAFNHAAPRVQFVSTPAYLNYEFHLFHQLAGVYKEYVKTLWYFVRWGITPVEFA